MNRRSAVKSLMIIAGGIALMPSCSTEPGKSSIQLSHIDIDASLEALLAEISETIIPKSDSPGAKDLNLHLFTLKMVDDCHGSEDQKQFVNGLKSFDKYSKDNASKNFADLKTPERQELLGKIEKDDSNKDLQAFMKITKRRVVQGFMNSKYVMRDLKKYEMVPSRYNPAVKVDA